MKDIFHGYPVADGIEIVSVESVQQRSAELFVIRNKPRVGYEMTDVKFKWRKDSLEGTFTVPVFESDDVDNISITAVTGHADIANVLRAAGKNALATAMKKVVESLLP
eukprot:GEMP01067598.1.p2 GENE.GEMP01067598.1~~GEMP01067598.1.p2  ORF type:complete len:108 (+),score=13.93 GEMP01067598.1:324-647(+)